MTSYHKLVDIKQHEFIFLQFYSSNITVDRPIFPLFLQMVDSGTLWLVVQLYSLYLHLHMDFYVCVCIITWLFIKDTNHRI
jgi:hypothetical protein